MTKPDQTWIGDEFRGQVTTQVYGRGAGIDGVEIIDLLIMSDEGGDFCEVTRFTPEGTLVCKPDYRPAQISYSLMEPGTIKAWHLHLKQDDLWFVMPAGRLVVGLLDVRSDSATYRQHMRLTLGAGRARLLVIPRGVAHGVANLQTHSTATLIYFTNTAFDPHDPDEHRLPWDTLGEQFWTIQPG